MNAANHIRDWLKQLGVRIAPSIAPREFAGRINVLAEDLAEEFPTEAFTHDSMKHVARQCPRYWPSFGELCEALAPWWREHRVLPTALPQPPPQLPPQPTPEECEYASRLVAGMVAELRAHEIETREYYAKQQPEWHRPRSEMTRAQLNEAYKRAGLKGPQLPKPAVVVPLRPVAADMPRDVKRGPILEADPP